MDLLIKEILIYINKLKVLELLNSQMDLFTQEFGHKIKLLDKENIEALKDNCMRDNGKMISHLDLDF